MSLEWDTTFPTMFLKLSILDAMASTVAITIYKGIKPSVETIESNWTDYKTGSSDMLVHYTGGVWTQQPLSGNMIGLSTIPATKPAIQNGDASWAIIWMSNVTDVQVGGTILPNASFIVVDCSNIGGKGVVRFSDIAFVSGVTKVISEASVETN